MVLLDVGDEWPEGVSAPEFVRVLAQKVGLNGELAVDPFVDEVRRSRELANAFAARLRFDLPEACRWIVIDGLDRVGVADDVHKVVGHLAMAAEASQLGNTRLIVTGHSGEFAPAVLDVLVAERIQTIDRTHVERFFTDVATDLGMQLVGGEAATLADRVLGRAPIHDLRGVEQAVRRVAEERFGR